MTTSRVKTGLDRIYIRVAAQQIGLWEEFTTTFEGEVVKKQSIERWINPGDDLSGEEELVQLIANTYFNSL